MEKISDCNYFEVKLCERKREIKNEDKIRRYVKQILVGLSEIHRNGIIHADLKLDNLLLHREEGKDPVVKICDFGISQTINVVDEDGVAKALMKLRSGTAAYIAPEIKGNNKLVGPEIDMWAFGIILYEMCVAYKPT
jgi:serine/threonine protein kinase KIN1/2